MLAELMRWAKGPCGIPGTSVPVSLVDTSAGETVNSFVRWTTAHARKPRQTADFLQSLDSHSTVYITASEMARILTGHGLPGALLCPCFV